MDAPKGFEDRLKITCAGDNHANFDHSQIEQKPKVIQIATDTTSKLYHCPVLIALTRPKLGFELGAGEEKRQIGETRAVGEGREFPG